MISGKILRKNVDLPLKDIQLIEEKVKDDYSGNAGHLQEEVFDHPFL